VRGYHDHLVGMLPATARLSTGAAADPHHLAEQLKFYPQLITVQEGSKDATPRQLSTGPDRSWGWSLPLAPVIWASAWGCAGTKRSLDQWFVDALSFEGSDWQHVCMIIWVRGNHRLLWRTLCAHSPKDHAVHCCSPQHSTCLHRTGSQGQCWGVGGEHRVLDGLAPEMKQHLIMNRFCNTDRPLQQLRLAALTGSSVTYRTPSGYTWLHFKSNILIAINGTLSNIN
jgi:hypothetical protein